jgi:hypothetical protein
LSNKPPQPPNPPRQEEASPAPIVDMRGAFARTAPQSEQDRADARAFIQGKIEMVLSDPSLTEAQKAEAIAGLEAKRDAIPPAS